MSQEIAKWTNWISELQAVAQEGLSYCKNPFDLSRFCRVRELACEMVDELAKRNGAPFDQACNVFELFSKEIGYLTPKLDMRAFIVKDGCVLLVQERTDGLWSLPGGWCDVNESPKEAVTREVFEETGYEAEVIKLLAFYDKQKHGHPPQLPHAYKCFFLCEITGGAPKINDEIQQIDFFPVDDLPDLSTHRVTQGQIRRVFELSQNLEYPTEVD